MGIVVWDDCDCAFTKVKKEQEKSREKNRFFFMMYVWLKERGSGVLQQNYLFNLKWHNSHFVCFT